MRNTYSGIALSSEWHATSQVRFFPALLIDEKRNTHVRNDKKINRVGWTYPKY
jgi:hypothetical protein